MLIDLLASFEKDKRGVAAIVGFVFLFGILVIGLSIYQGAVVPQQNAEIEFNHNERVEGDIVTVRDTLHNVGSDDDLSSQNTPVTLGAQYPERWIAINPPAPTGTLSTTDTARTVEIEAEDGEQETFETRTLRYEPNYAAYDKAPNTVIEHTLVYNDFENTDLIVERETLFQDGEVTLPLIEGEFSKTDSGTVSVRTVASEKRPATDIFELSGDDEVNITLPTDVPDLWEDVDQERDDVSVDTEDSLVNITAEAGAVNLVSLQLDRNIESQLDQVAEETGPVVFSEAVDDGISDGGSGEYDSEGSQLSTDLWDEEGNMDAGDVDEDFSENTLIYTNQSADVSEFEVEAEEGVTVYTENDFETGDEFEIDNVDEGDAAVYTGGDFTGEELEIENINEGDLLMYTDGDFTVEELEIDNVDDGDVHFYVGGDFSVDDDVDVDNVAGDVILYDENQNYGDLEDEKDETRDVDEFPEIEF